MTQQIVNNMINFNFSSGDSLFRLAKYNLLSDMPSVIQNILKSALSPLVKLSYSAGEARFVS